MNLNAFLALAVAATAVAALIVAYDPRAAKRLASVIYARALAVESAREMYSVARRSGVVLGTVVKGS